MLLMNWLVALLNRLCKFTAAAFETRQKEQQQAICQRSGSD